jgi:catechol 2,3-dioxygenase-like lactoylglutathione lyase family enzyme
MIGTNRRENRARERAARSASEPTHWVRRSHIVQSGRLASPSRYAFRCVPLNHVALTVSDRKRSQAFYGQHFGLTERIHDDEHRLIIGSPDGSLLALSEGMVPRGLPRTNHFGFEVGDPDEVRVARERLRESGVRETEWQDDAAFVRVQVADPDGYRVELFAYS